MISPEIRREVIELLSKEQFSKASELVVENILNNLKIYTTKEDKQNEMWIYKEGIYVPQGRSEIKEKVRIIMGEYYNTTFINQILAKIETDTYIESEAFFNTNIIDEIPVKNGILNVITKEISAFNQDKIFFTKLNVTYNPESKCPMIEKFLSEVLKYKDDVKVFYELAGFGLYKDYFIEKAIMCVGNGRNGKSKSIELLKRLYSPENCKNIPLSALKYDSFIISELHGKLLNLAGDISSEALKDTGIFKSLVGRDMVTTKRKYLNSLSFINHAKFIFACNELPRVYDATDGFWDRWILLEFPYKFVNQNEIDSAEPKEREFLKLIDTNIIDKITTDEELSGLLNLALEGLERLLKNKKFSYSTGTKEIKDIWIRKSDSFMAFCMDNLEQDFESGISKKEIRKEYNSYCRKHKAMGVSDKSIKATLQQIFGVVEEYNKSLEGQNQEWFWMGIRFKKDEKTKNINSKEEAIEFFKNSNESIIKTDNIPFPLYLLIELRDRGIIYNPKEDYWSYLG